jgi:hypothetical protein
MRSIKSLWFVTYVFTLFFWYARPAIAATPFEDYVEYRKTVERMTHASDLRRYYLNKDAAQLQNGDDPLNIAMLKALTLDFLNPVLINQKIEGTKATLVVEGANGSRYTSEWAKIANQKGQGKVTVEPPAPGKRRMTIPMELEDGVWKSIGENTSTAAPTATTPENSITRSIYKDNFVNKPLSGMLNGKPFILTDAVLNKCSTPNISFLELKHSTNDWHDVIFRVGFFDINDNLFSRESIYKDDAASIAPDVEIRSEEGKPGTKSTKFDSGSHWGMRLRLLPPKDGKVSGYIAWRANNKTRDHLEGYFYAKVNEMKWK